MSRLVSIVAILLLLYGCSNQDQTGQEIDIAPEETTQEQPQEHEPEKQESGLELDSCIEALSSNNAATVRGALTVLEKMGSKAEPAAPQVAALLESDIYPPVNYWGSGTNPSIGERAARTLAAIGKASVPFLAEAVRSESSVARLNAVKGLGRIADSSVAGPLLQALQDQEAETRELARLHLKQGDATFTAPIFMEACSGDDPFVRSTALIALGRIRDRKATDVVLRCLNDPDVTVRESALWVLADAKDWIMDKQAIPPLLGALSHKDANIRSGAALSLGQYKDPQSVDPLASLLDDEDKTVRAYAALSLGQIGDSRALPSLVRALEMEQGPYVRDQILYAMGELGDPEALPVLLEVLKGDSTNRFNAGQAFEKITGKPFSQHLDWIEWIESQKK